MDWTQIIPIYNGPLHIINNYNNTCVSNSKIQYTTKDYINPWYNIINKLLWKMKATETQKIQNNKHEII